MFSYCFCFVLCIIVLVLYYVLVIIMCIILQSAGATMVPVDSTQVSNNQQPTYVLLQAPNDTDSSEIKF